MPAYVLSSNVKDCTYCKGTSVSLSDCFKLMITHTASSHLVWLPGSNKYPIRLYTMHINHSEEKKDILPVDAKKVRQCLMSWTRSA